MDTRKDKELGPSRHPKMQANIRPMICIVKEMGVVL